jgi:predicted RNA-binding Zn-ribbon protein involved in translation (DUF1610 family)
MKKRQDESKHIPLPKETTAFFCATCGAVSLDPDGICKVQGRGTKGDWCGTKDPTPPRSCKNRVNNARWVCDNCGKVSVNPGLLCEPRDMKADD